MADLLQSAKLFEVSVMLQAASRYLIALADGKTAEPVEEETLKWTGEFLMQVDWTSVIAEKSGVEGNFAVSATNTRPKFYASLIKLAPDLEQAGIDTSEKLAIFLQDIYRLMISGGQEGEKPSPAEMKIAAKLLHLLSESIIVDLTGNGLPREERILSAGMCS